MKKIIVLFFCFYPAIQYAQIKKIDSLKIILADCENDSCITEVSKNIFWLLSDYDVDEAFLFAKEKYNYFNSSGYEKGIAYSAQELTIIYRKFGDYASSIKILNNALNNVKKPEFRIFLLQNLAEEYRATENHTDAVKILNEALKIAYLFQDDFNIAHIYNRMAANNFKLGTFEELKNNIDSSEFYAEKIESLSLIASNYEILGAVYSFQNKHKKAISFYRRSMTLNLKLKDTIALQNNYNNLGNAYFLMEDYSEAIKYLNKSAEICAAKNFKMNLLNSITYLGHTYRKIKDYEKASFYFDSALDMRVHLFNEQRDTEIQNYIKKYEFQKKEVQINQQNQLLVQKEIIISQQKKQKHGLLIAFFLALAILTILLLLRRKLISKNDKISKQRIGLEKINAELLNKNKKINRQKNVLDLISDKYFKSYKNEEKQKQLIIEQKQQLEKISNFKELQTQMIVHDLKNPLSRIIETTNDNIKLRNNALFMLNLVENILNISKIRQDFFSINFQQIGLNDVIQDAINSTEFLFINKGIEFNNELDYNYTVLSDFEILKRIFINIFTNAVRYTNSGGEIYVRAKKVKDKLQIEVKDTGIGIEKEKINEIFEIYKSSISEKSHNVSSSGIGLYFVKKAVEAHGRNIIVLSEPNKGTSFIFELKLIEKKRKGIIPKKVEAEKISLTENDKAVLKPYINKLKKIKIYEISELKTVLNQIVDNGRNIKKWKKELSKSIENYNTKLFEILLTVEN
ncbi:MAG: tetratricopeptide repeat-containing sensor histidine kinase [Bacteroidales bacterium]|nr:tetratricopeptide repeat-containing sensor histidine kinase [Bacteroidales bacterium]